MIRSWRRPLLAVALSMAAGIAGLAVPTPASAEPPSGPATGTFTLTGDPDDEVTQGESFSYSTESGMTADLYGGSFAVQVDVRDPETGVSFFLVLASGGGPLTPGTTYTGATAWPYQESTPGMLLGGNGANCGPEISGSFTIHDIRVGPYHYVEKLDATFEHRCDGGEAAARGEVHLTNPPAPPLLDPQATVEGTGTIVLPRGPITVQGTLTCGQAALVEMIVRVQQGSRIVTLGVVNVPCIAGQAVPWTATGSPPDGVRLKQGNALVIVQIYSRDPFYDVPVQVNPPPFPTRLTTP